MDLIYEIQLQSPFNTKILAKLPSARPTAGCGAVLVDDKIFIFGGSKENEAATAEVMMYDIIKNEFKELQTLPYGVCKMLFWLVVLVNMVLTERAKIQSSVIISRPRSALS